MVALGVFSARLLAQPPEGWIGTWRLNLAESTYDPGPPPYKRATYRIERWDGRVKVTYDMVHPRGGVTHLEWTGKFDGTPYPVQGIDELITYAYRPLGAGAFEVTVRADDRIAAVSRITLSPDGRKMITTTAGRDARGRRVSTTTVYRRE